VQINVDLLNNYICWSHEAKLATEKLIPWIADADDESWEDFPTKPTSTKCIAEQCRRVGIPCAPVKSDDEEAYAEWEALYAPAHPWIQALTAWRSINKLYRTFMVMHERLRPDGTMPFALKYFGAHTGRWSGDARVNLQNQRRRPILIRIDGLLEQSPKRELAAIKEHAETGHWPAWVKYAIDFRHLIIPRPGKKMIVSDLSQIEPRVLAWLTGNKELLAMLKSGMSIYEAHARSTMSWTGGKLKDENPGLYSLAKARVLALGYQAGCQKFIVMAQDLAGLDITQDDPEFETVINPVTGMPEQIDGYGCNSRRIVREFRADNPKIVDLWNKLNGSFRASVAGDFSMTLPSGREMNYRRVRGDTKFEKDENTGRVFRKSVYTADADGRRKQYYGGKLVENLVQATARDVLAEQMVRMDDAGLTQLFSVHDEVILEVEPDITAADIEAHMSYCPEWLAGCPVSAETQEVKHYQK
jgi:DNA polymerase